MRNQCQCKTNSIWLVFLLGIRDPRQTTTAPFIQRNWVLVVAQMQFPDSLLDSARQNIYQKIVLEQSQDMAGLMVYSVHSLPRIQGNLYRYIGMNICANKLSVHIHFHDCVDVETITQVRSNHCNLPNRNDARMLLILLIAALLSDERNQCTEFYGGQAYDYDNQQNSVHMATLCIDAICS